MSWLRLVRTGQRAHVLQRLPNLETVGSKQLDRELLAFQNGIVSCWKKWTTSSGQVVDTRVLGKLDKLYVSEEACRN